MKCFLIVLFFMSNVSFGASGSGNVSNVLSLGGVSTSSDLEIAEPNSQGYFTMYGGGSLTANDFYPLYKDGVQYKVGASSSYHMTKFCAVTISTTPSGVQLASSATIFAYGASSISSGTYQGGVSEMGIFLPGPVAYTHTCWDTTYAVASSSYVGIQYGASSTLFVSVTGKETTP